MRKWFEMITDPEFIMKHSKKIIFIASAGIIFCLFMVFIMLAHSNIESDKEKATEKHEETAKETTKIATLEKQKQEEILDKTLVNTFTFEDLSFKSPDVTKSSDALMNMEDFMIDSYKDNLLMSTNKEQLYFYNITDASTSYVSDLSIYNQISGKYLYYVEVVDSMGSELRAYNIETKKTEMIDNLEYTQSISGVGRIGDIVYYIVNEGGKSHITTRYMGDDIYGVGKNIRFMNVEVPMSTYMTQEGDKVYVINTSGFYEIKDSSLNRLGDTPTNLIYDTAKVYKGKPIVYGYNATTKTSQLWYNGKVLTASNYIFEYNPINEKYILINENNFLGIMNIETLKRKRISDSVGSSAVVNGSIFFSIDREMHSDGATDFYYYEKK